MLTTEEINRFWDQGFLIIENVFTKEEIDRLTSIVEEPAIREELRKRKADERVVHLIPLTTRHPAFKDLVCDSRITSRVAKLIGDDLQLSNSKLATKPLKCGAGAFDWHQDFAYYLHSNSDLVTASVALDDVSPDNGGMYVVAGSHRFGLLNHFEDGWMIGRCLESKYWENDPEKVVPLSCKAGGLTIHHCLSLHGSPGNTSGRPRRLALFQYRAGHSYQMSDQVWDDTGLQVFGSPTRRVKCEAMDVLLPKSKEWHRYSGEPHGSVYRQIGERARQWNAKESSEQK